MRKVFIVALAAVLAIAFALPAMADFKTEGFLRTKGWMSNFEDGGAGAGALGSLPFKDKPTAAWVEQRLRMKNSWGDDNLRAVWFLENNLKFGDAGGKIGADAKDIQTKNLYVWFKVPDTSVDVSVGVVNWKDSYEGLFFNNDSAGVFINGKLDPVAYRLFWTKFYENTIAKADDSDLYGAEVKFAPAKDVKLGVNLYFLKERFGASGFGVTMGGASDLAVYMPGVDFAAAAGPVALSGFAFYQGGKAKDSAGTTLGKIAGYAVDLRGDLALGPGKAFLEGLYVSGGDGSSDKFKSIVTGNSSGVAGNAAFGRMDLQIITFNPDDCSAAGAMLGTGTNDINNGGRGVVILAAGYSQKFSDKIAGKVGLGYATAVKKLITDPAAKKKDMGTEINANVNYSIMKGLDLGLYGAYALLGDFYKSGTTSPDDAYATYARLNYAF